MSPTNQSIPEWPRGRAHLAPEYLRAEVDPLTFGAAVLETVPDGGRPLSPSFPPLRGAKGRFPILVRPWTGPLVRSSHRACYPVATRSRVRKGEGRNQGRPSHRIPALKTGAGNRIRTGDPQLGNLTGRRGTRGNGRTSPILGWFSPGESRPAGQDLAQTLPTAARGIRATWPRTPLESAGVVATVALRDRLAREQMTPRHASSRWTRATRPRRVAAPRCARRSTR